MAGGGAVQRSHKGLTHDAAVHLSRLPVKPWLFKGSKSGG
jgi:hypothetical protein